MAPVCKRLFIYIPKCSDQLFPQYILRSHKQTAFCKMRGRAWKNFRLSRQAPPFFHLGSHHLILLDTCVLQRTPKRIDFQQAAANFQKIQQHLRFCGEYHDPTICLPISGMVAYRPLPWQDRIMPHASNTLSASRSTVRLTWNISIICFSVGSFSSVLIL